MSSTSGTAWSCGAMGATQKRRVVNLTSSRAKPKTQEQDEELAPWEIPQTEGDPAIAEGQEIEPAEVMATIAADDTMQNLMDWCVQYMQDNAQDNAAVMAAEVRRILAGESPEDVLAESQPLAGKDHTEKPFLLRGFTINPGDFH